MSVNFNPTQSAQGINVFTNLTDNGNYSGIISISIGANTTVNATIYIDGLYLTSLFYFASSQFLLNTSAYFVGYHNVSLYFVESFGPKTAFLSYWVYFSNGLPPPPPQGIDVYTNLTNNGNYSGAFYVSITANTTVNATVYVDVLYLTSLYYVASS